MMYYRNRKNKKWQRKYIKEVFAKSNEHNNGFSKIILKNLDLLEQKNTFIPKYLFKYYSPTSDNILDVKNKRLWLSHPKQFNDPFDSNIGYDKEKFEKKCLLEFIKKNGIAKGNDISNGFSLDEKNRIERSYTEDFYYWKTDIESYFDAKHKILETKHSDFRKIINEYLHQQTNDLDNKIEKIKNIDIRIASFSNFDKYDEFYKQIVMWSHYADNHKGFCVEYDLSVFQGNIELTIEDYKFYDHKEEYLNERNCVAIKAGLFPVEYTSNRINIPVTKLRKINSLNSKEIISNKDIDELIYKTYIVKSANWNYEKEWRIIIDAKISNYYNNKIPFPYAKKIYLGCKADNNLIDTMMKIGEEIGVEVTILKMDNRKFILEDIGNWNYKYKKDMSTWNNPYR